MGFRKLPMSKRYLNLLKKDVPVSTFLAAIKGLLSKYGLYGQEIHAIGHFSQLSSQNIKVLTEMGFNMTDVPSKTNVYQI